MQTAPTPAALLKLLNVAEAAGQIIRDMKDRSGTLKADGSLVTEADFASNKILTQGIHEHLGTDMPILSEEVSKSTEEIKSFGRGFAVIIDPLDGTSNFSSGSPEYSVLVAITKDAVPVHGIVVVPAYGISISGGILQGQTAVRHHADGRVGTIDDLKKFTDIDEGALKAPAVAVPARFWNSEDPKVHQHIRDVCGDFMQARGELDVLPAKTIFSAALPFIFPQIKNRLYSSATASGGAGDWDLAAWDALIRPLGGALTNLAGKPLPYLTGHKHANYAYHQDANSVADYAAAVQSRHT